MKTYYTILISIILVTFSQLNTYGQCAQIVASPASAGCNTSYNFNVTGNFFGTTFDFNSGNLPAGWTATSFVIGTPCVTNMIDGSLYYWASAISGVRYVETNNLDVTQGGDIAFYMRYGSDDPSNGCEDPDVSNEGVFLQYSINNGTSWTTIDTWAPVSGYQGPLYQWNLYDYTIPPAAQTSSTKFRWYQPQNSGPSFDNWGLDIIEVSASSASATFAWDFGDGNTSSAQNPSHSYGQAGTYTVSLTVTHPNCNITVYETVVVGTGPTLTENHTDASSCSSSDGTISLTFNGAQAPINYSWTPTLPNSPNQTGLAPGFYDVIVSDANGCNANQTIEIECCTPPPANTPPIQELCGDSNSEGQIILSTLDNVIKSQPAHTISYYEDAGLNNMINSSAPFTVISTTIVYAVTNDGLCNSTTILVEFDVKAQLILTHSTTDDQCESSNGSVTLLVSGGTSPYQYSFDNQPFSGQDVYQSLNGGTYQAALQDVLGCTDQNNNIIVDQTPELILTANPTHTTCGLDNGSVDFTLSSGILLVSYYDGGNQITQFSDLAADTYSWDAVDGNGCTMTVDFEILPSTSIDIDLTATNTMCGQSNGMIDGTINSSNGSVDFYLDGATITMPTSGLSEGTYFVEAYDDLNCLYSENVIVNASMNFDFDLAATHTTCDLDNGGIDVILNSSNGPVTYTLNGAAISFPLSNLAPGSYTIMGEDGTGCALMKSTQIDPSLEMDITLFSTNSICMGPNGEIDVTVNSGQSPYTYTINGATTAMPTTNLSSGLYTIEATDANGCKATESRAIQASDPLDFTLTPVNTTCDMDNGMVSLTMNTGTSPVAYTLAGAAQTFPVMGLSPNGYAISGTDAEGCTLTTNIIIQDSDPLNFNLTTVNTLCAGINGEIDVNVLTGKNPISFTLDGTPASFPVTGLVSGSYEIEGVDGDGCMYTQNATIQASDPLEFTLTPTHTLCDGANGMIDVTVITGTNPVSYSLDGSPQTFPVNSLTAGNYIVDGVDDFGCTFNSNITIQGSDPLDFTVFKTPTSCGMVNGAISTFLNSGQTPITYTLVGIGSNNTGAFTDLAPGNYTLEGMDNIGCMSVENFDIDPSISLDLDINTTRTSCAKDNGRIDITINSANHPISTVLNGQNLGPATAMFSLKAGDYFVEVTDNEGCYLSFEVNVGESTLPVINAEVINTQCGEDNGSIDVTATLGIPPYSYKISPGPAFGSESLFEDLYPAYYFIYVKDSDGCLNLKPFKIEESAPIVYEALANNSECGIHSGQVIMTTSSGVKPIRFLLSNEYLDWETSHGIFLDLEPGEYHGTIIGDDGCTEEFDITVGLDSGPIVDATVNHPSCGQEDGSIRLDLRNTGVKPFKVFVNGVLEGSNLITNFNVNGLENGVYNIEIIDRYLCSGVASYTLNDGNSIIDELLVSDVDCDGNPGSILATIEDQGDYTFSLIGVDTNDVGRFLNLNAGIYNFEAKDSSGCSYSETVEIKDLTFGDWTMDIVEHCNLTATLSIRMANGNRPYSFSAAGKSSNNGILTVPNGDHTLVITDANGCSIEESITINVAPIIEYKIDFCFPPLTKGGAGRLKITASGGTKPYQYKLDNFTNGLGYFWNLHSTVYSLTITDANGCLLEETFTLCSGGGSGEAKADGPIVYRMNDSQNMSISPNPTSNVIYVDGILETDMQSIKIYNINGVQLNNTHSNIWNENRLQIDVTDLKNGIYILYNKNTGEKTRFIKI